MKRYKNQTEIGKIFGISAIAVGKILTNFGLKDNQGATEKALKEKYAIAVESKKGFEFFLWDDKKLGHIISKLHNKLSLEDYWINVTKENILNLKRDRNNNQEDSLFDKIYYMIYDLIPSQISSIVRNKVDFDLTLDDCHDFNKAIYKFTSDYIDDKKELDSFKNMIKKYYPEHLNKLKTFITFSWNA